MIIGSSKENDELKSIIEEKDYYTLAGELTLEQYNDIEEIVQKKNISKKNWKKAVEIHNIG